MSRKKPYQPPSTDQTESEPRSKALELYEARILREQQLNMQLTWVGYSLLLFSLVCFMAQIYFNSAVSGTVKQYNVPLSGGVVGPFQVKKDNASYKFEIKQNNIRTGYWYAVDIEVLNAHKQFVFGFGHEFWRESGYDEGHWDERVDDMTMHAHFEQAGKYYLSVTTQSNASLNKSDSDYYIEVSEVKGSVIAFDWLKVVSFWLAVLALIYRYRDRLEIES